ncbi:AraD1 family protein [Nitrincola iocasae]|uniref:AraD1 family protein n=1 Tax=Nitrincola iocasae TaxID=2614693 RepID=UPI001CD944BE|nr:AraD1 family protein [Nitrincola iocasae]
MTQLIRLIQYIDNGGQRQVGLVNVQNGEQIERLEGAGTTYTLAQKAIAAGSPLKTHIDSYTRVTEPDSLSDLLAQRRVLVPLDHPDPAHCYITGTGLTHTGSASTRDKMHSADHDTEQLTDSMKMFRMGLEGGKPTPGTAGVQPEWFYKGDGSILVAPEHTFPIPSFSLDASEEPELVGCYLNAADGTPFRVGFALGNELSDHITERQNYLFLAHSKLRVCSFGPELLVGELPNDIRGTSRIIRNGETVWEKPFLSGEANMSHTIANLEHHHFKYKLFRRGGDVNLHYFGTATLSFADMRTAEGDTFEIQADAFGKPLSNSWQVVAEPDYFGVEQL